MRTDYLAFTALCWNSIYNTSPVGLHTIPYMAYGRIPMGEIRYANGHNPYRMPNIPECQRCGTVLDTAENGTVRPSWADHLCPMVSSAGTQPDKRRSASNVGECKCGKVTACAFGSDNRQEVRGPTSILEMSRDAMRSKRI